MRNKIKIFQGFMILVILLGSLGAIVYLKPALDNSLSSKGAFISAGDVRLVAANESVMVASVAWNHWNRDKHKSVAWNRTRKW
jgi:hypothetical protein